MKALSKLAGPDKVWSIATEIKLPIIISKVLWKFNCHTWHGNNVGRKAGEMCDEICDTAKLLILKRQ